MQTEAFDEGPRELLDVDREAGPLAIMCAEAVPGRCHRSLVVDALVARGLLVAHILGPGPARPHRLNPLARIQGATLGYPAADSPRDYARPRK